MYSVLHSQFTSVLGNLYPKRLWHLPSSVRPFTVTALPNANMACFKHSIGPGASRVLVEVRGAILPCVPFTVFRSDPRRVLKISTRSEINGVQVAKHRLEFFSVLRRWGGAIYTENLSVLLFAQKVSARYLLIRRKGWPRRQCDSRTSRRSIATEGQKRRRTRQI